MLDRAIAVGEGRERLARPEEADKGAVLDHQQGVGSRGGQSLQGIDGTDVSRAGRANGLQDSAERGHQAAAMASATSRAVSAPTGWPAGVVTRITCRPLSRSRRTPSDSGTSGRTSGKG